MDRALYDDIRYGTNIIPEEEYLETITTIAEVASSMVEKTLGPHGKTTMLNEGSYTYPTKDGWNVLKSLIFNDPVNNVLYSVLRQVSFDLVSKVGDGTTTAFVGATLFAKAIRKYEESLDDTTSFRQADFLNELTKISEEIIENISSDRFLRTIDTDGDYEDIRNIALVASNGNEELADMIQKIYQETNNPNIYVSLDSGEKLDYFIQKGFKLDCKVFQQKWYRNTEEGEYIESSPMEVYIFDHNVTYQDHGELINAILNIINSKHMIGVIVAPHFDDVLSGMLRHTMEAVIQKGSVPNILLIQVPLSMEIHRKYMKDLVTLTNAQIYDYEKVKAFNAKVFNDMHPDEDPIHNAILETDDYKGKTTQEMVKMNAGRINRLIAGEKYIIVQDYEQVANPILLKEILDDAKEEYLKTKKRAEASTTNLHKDYMDAHQHYTKLYGNFGEISVGANSELEKLCLKDAVDDAVLACRSAFDNGYVRGMNLDMMSVITEMIHDEEDEQRKDILQMIFNVFYDIALKVLRNKYTNENAIVDVSIKNQIDGEVLRHESLKQTDIIDYALSNGMGFDLKTDTMLLKKECPVINSVKTDIEILKGMISILSTMMTSNQFLSLNRSYDRTIGLKQKEAHQLDRKVDEYKAITEAVVEVLKKNVDWKWK